MNNFEKMQLCYTDVLDTACDLSAMLKEENDIIEFEFNDVGNVEMFEDTVDVDAVKVIDNILNPN